MIHFVQFVVQQIEQKEKGTEDGYLQLVWYN